MLDDLNGFVSDSEMLVISNGLKRADNDGLTSVDTHGVDVFEGSWGEAVIEHISDDFVLEFFPSSQILFKQNLRRGNEGNFAELNEFFNVLSETRSETA